MIFLRCCTFCERQIFDIQTTHNPVSETLLRQEPLKGNTKMFPFKLVFINTDFKTRLFVGQQFGGLAPPSPSLQILWTQIFQAFWSCSYRRLGVVSNCILGLFFGGRRYSAFIDLIHDVRHLYPRFRIDGIKARSRGSLACATDETKLWLKGLCHGSPVHFV